MWEWVLRKITLSCKPITLVEGIKDCSFSVVQWLFPLKKNREFVLLVYSASIVSSEYFNSNFQDPIFSPLCIKIYLWSWIVNWCCNSVWDSKLYFKVGVTEREIYRDNTHTHTLHPFVHSPNGFGSQVWAKMNPGSRNFIQVS